MTRRSCFFLGLMAILLTSCSTNKVLHYFADPLVHHQYLSLMEETDYSLAESAIPSGLKLMEALLVSDPGNRELLLKLSEGFCGYAFGFIEDREPERASQFYLRGKAYAKRAMSGHGNAFLAAKSFPEFENRLSTLPDESMPALFWLGQCWGGWLNLNADDLSALADIPKLEKIFRKVLSWDETYELAGAHLLLGGYWGSRPKLLGGDWEKSRSHFERNFELTDNKFLLTHYWFAKTLAVQTQDRKLFERLLTVIEETPSDSLPEKVLLNVIAKKKAQILKEKIDVLF